jgi:hypothetical protein
MIFGEDYKHESREDLEDALCSFFGQVTGSIIESFGEIMKSQFLFDFLVRKKLYSEFLTRKDTTKIDSALGITSRINCDYFSNLQSFVNFCWLKFGIKPICYNRVSDFSILLDLAFFIYFDFLSEKATNSLTPPHARKDKPVLLGVFSAMIKLIFQDFSNRVENKKLKSAKVFESLRTENRELKSRLTELHDIIFFFEHSDELLKAENKSLRSEMAILRNEKDLIFQSRINAKEEIRHNETTIHQVILDNNNLESAKSDLVEKYKNILDENKSLLRDLEGYKSLALMVPYYREMKSGLEKQLSLAKDHHNYLEENLNGRLKEIGNLRKLVFEREKVCLSSNEMERQIVSDLVYALLEETECYIKEIHNSRLFAIENQHLFNFK